MDPRTAEELDSIVQAPLSLSLQADLVMGLLTRENVTEVMERLPGAFRDEFVAFAREVYVPEGARLVLDGAAMPAASLDAVRFWIRQADAARVAGHRNLDGLLAEGEWIAPWPDVRLAYARLRADRETWALEQEERHTWDAVLNDSMGDDGHAEAR